MKITFNGNIELAEIHGLKTENVDMHSHLLPAFDDGVSELEESLKIIRQIKQKGAEALFWTPHLNLGSFGDITKSTITEHFKEYVDIIRQQTGIELFCGSELFCSPPIPEKLVPLGDSDFVLIEFPLDVYPRYLFDTIYNIQISGYRVIMAHVERYQWLFPKKKRFFKTTVDYSLVKELKTKGVYFQVNYSTIKKISLHKEVMPILKEKKIEFIGSDKHHERDNRPLIDFIELNEMDF
ncbi:MAG: CpsB/CapC family capsule biosynthesis tyrosine phosphatase [Thermotogota bacterium]|nr:CpsB/CapC family capsule biosynthesis tyrosine phosphatase [Thermotogota bacterium]